MVDECKGNINIVRNSVSMRDCGDERKVQSKRLHSATWSLPFAWQQEGLNAALG